jgi:hypothetical protein
MIDGFIALADLACGLVGWRAVIGLLAGGVIAGVLAWVHLPTRADVSALVALTALGYIAGAWWEYAAMKAHRRSAPPRA